MMAQVKWRRADALKESENYEKRKRKKFMKQHLKTFTAQDDGNMQINKNLQSCDSNEMRKNKIDTFQK